MDTQSSSNLVQIWYIQGWRDVRGHFSIHTLRSGNDDGDGDGDRDDGWVDDSDDNGKGLGLLGMENVIAKVMVMEMVPCEFMEGKQGEDRG